MAAAQATAASTAATSAVPRLSLQCAPIGPDTTTIRSLDWDRSRVDIEFGRRNGTTYNSFLGRR
ncbi:MAG: diflavin flavoprotein A, partial [Cyanobium sp.]